jgi:hypothetical protein
MYRVRATYRTPRCGHVNAIAQHERHRILPSLLLYLKTRIKRCLSCLAEFAQRSTFRLNASGTVHLVAQALSTTRHRA